MATDSNLQSSFLDLSSFLDRLSREIPDLYLSIIPGSQVVVWRNTGYQVTTFEWDAIAKRLFAKLPRSLHERYRIGILKMAEEIRDSREVPGYLTTHQILWSFVQIMAYFKTIGS